MLRKPMSLNDPVAEAPVITQKTFKKVQVNVQERLEHCKLAGMASDLRARMVEEHLTQTILAHFHTFLLGGNFQTVHLEETVEWKSPETWWDHLKQDLTYRLWERGWHGLAIWLRKRVKFQHYSRKVFKQQEVPTHLCPHVAVSTKHGTDLVHFAWMDGQVEEAQAMREKLAWNGKKLH